MAIKLPEAIQKSLRTEPAAVRRDFPNGENSCHIAYECKI
ncbi:secretion chaperone [Prevotella nigrescens ATCC 33563]|nr:secretion chaperone [Prevotella nigrescens ATCC 33563]